MEAAKCPDDPRLTNLVGELSVQDKQFAEWWAARNVATLSTGTKTLRPQLVGSMVLDWDTLVEANDTDQSLVIWTAEPNSPSREALEFLASWAASKEQDVERATSLQ